MNELSSSESPPAIAKASGAVWFGLFVYPFFLLFLGYLIPGAWIGFAAVVGLIFLCRSVFLWNKLAFILLLPLLVYKFSSFVSNLLISLGFFIPEIGRYGEADLSPATYLVVTSIHFTVIVFFAAKWIGPQENFTQKNFVRLPAELDIAFLFIFGLILFQIFILIYTGVTHGFPLLMAMDRFVYRSINAGSEFINILNYKAAIALLSSMYIASPEVSRRRKIIIGGGYLALFSMYTLFSEKFHALLLICALFSLPFLARKPDLFSKYVRRILPAMTATLLLAFVLVYYVYSDYGNQSAAVTIERIFGRMSQQSQLWYIATRTFSGPFYFDMQSLSMVWDSLFIKGVDNRLISLGIGSYYFVFRFSPVSVQQSLYDMQGLNQLTQVSEAYWLSVAGLPGLIGYIIVSAIVYSAVMVLLARSLITTNFITTYLWGTTFVFLMTSLNQGLPHQIFGRDYLRWYLLAALVHLGYSVLQRTAFNNTIKTFRR